MAAREAGEETGLEGLSLLDERPFDVDVHAIPARASEPAHLHLDLRYRFRAPSGSRPRASAESKAIAWVPFDDPRLRGDLERPLAKLR